MRRLAPSATHAPRLALSFGALLLSSSTACRAPVFYRYPARSPAPEVQAHAATLRSAQGSHLDAPSGDQRAWLVFDRRVDPTTLRSSSFILVFDDDTRAYPNAVHLAGADQGFDARSIVLEGEFLTSDGHWRLARVQIVGPVYGADGQPFRGSSIAVTPPAAPYPVAARRLPDARGNCPDQTVRIYFSDAVESAPSEVQRHEHTFRRASNRHDLCAGPSARISVEAGLVVGTGMQGNLAGQVDVEVSP